MTTRDELVALVAKAHADAPYAEASEAGRQLAAQSKMPRLVAQNLGAGFGQWDFFPEATEVVDFALAYDPPSDEAGMMELARKWASDDANNRHTIMNLVGKEILVHELKRLEIPKLKELVEASRSTRALEARKALGFEIPAGAEAKAEAKAAAKAARAAKAANREPAVSMGLTAPIRMPKPKFVKPPPKAAPAAARRFSHPKFGEGILEKSDGVGEEMKLTVKFESGTKTLQAKFLTEVTSASDAQSQG